LNNPFSDESTSRNTAVFDGSGCRKAFFNRLLSDRYGICARSGFHCAEPLHEQCKFPATVRLSVYLYNQPEEIDQFFDALATITAFGSHTS
jgi:selenocysteine lyase/cysteine desulfurase